MSRKSLLGVLVGLCLTVALVAQDADKAKQIRLKVTLPAAAELEIEGAKTKSTGPVRVFVSPAVEVGPNYIYTLRAVWTENGKPVEVKKDVKVKPGETTEVTIAKEEVAAADKTKDKEPKKFREPDVIFVPTPQEVVDKMLELATVKKDDLVYDLGCGNGIIVVTAAKKYGCKAVGFDIDPERIKESNENVKQNKVEALVTIKQEDIFTLDLSKVNVITLYLLPQLNVKLLPQLEKMKDGSRIVTHDFDIKGIKPDKVVTVNANEREHTVYLFTLPLKREKD